MGEVAVTTTATTVPAVTNVTTTTLPRLHHLADQCYGHHFPTYYSNNKKNGTGLLDVFSREEADRGFLVQYIGPAPNHYRKFLLFRNALEFWRSHRRSIPEAHRCFCETVRDREQNMRFDIDLSRNKWPPGVEFGQRYADRVMNWVVGTTLEVMQVRDHQRNVVVCTSHGPDKFSYHIVIRGRHLRDAAAAKRLFLLVLAKLPDEMRRFPRNHDKDDLLLPVLPPGAIDPSVYGRLQQFRLLGSQKPGSNRPKRFCDTWHYEGFGPVEHQYAYTGLPLDEVQFLESLVGWVDERLSTLYEPPVPAPHRLPPPGQAKQKASLASSRRCRLRNADTSGGNNDSTLDPGDLDFDLKAALSLLEPRDAFEVREVRNHLVMLRRLRPTHCLVCDRVHESENPYLLIQGEERVVWLDCRRDSLRRRLRLGALGGSNPELRQHADPQDGSLLGPVRTDLIEYCEKRVRPFDIPLERVLDQNAPATCLLLQSAMGSGKSYAIREWLRQLRAAWPRCGSTFRHLRVLWLSPRHIYAVNVTGECRDKAGLPFRCYTDPDIGPSLSAVNWLVLQMESLHRLDLDCRPPYDVLVFDESESCLAQFSSLETMSQHLPLNVVTFERLVRSSRVVIAADAFLSQKTYRALCSILREPPGTFSPTPPPPAAVIRVERNTFRPETRRAFHHQSLESFQAEALRQLRVGRRLVMVWASKKKMLRFCHLLEELNLSHLAYHDRTDDDAKARLGDVRREWNADRAQVVCFTPTITVGVSYDAEDFDALFVYGSCYSCRVRDLLQMSYRVRHLASGEMHFCMWSRYFGSDCHLLPIHDAEMLASLQQKALSIDEFQRQSHLADSWFEERPWLARVHAANQLEQNLTKLRFEAELARYLDLCGYRWIELPRPGRHHQDDPIEDLADGGHHSDEHFDLDYGIKLYESLPDLRADPNLLSDVKARVNAHAASEEDKLALDRFYFDSCSRKPPRSASAPSSTALTGEIRSASDRSATLPPRRPSRCNRCWSASSSTSASRA